MNAPLLEIGDLSVRFATERGLLTAVDRIALSLSPKETLGIVGESGCGKTVTSRAIMGLLPRTGRIDGSIRFLGKELVGADRKTWQQIRGAQIGMVFQEPMTALNPVFSIGYQVAEAVHAHRKVSRKEGRALALEMLEKVGIPAPRQRIDEYPHQLSGGMRQRVMIAMALAMKPRILLADEPTTALDVTVQAQILDLVGSLQEENQMAVVMITHDLGVVAETCDRVAVMYAGRIVEEGTVEEIFEQPLHPYTRGLMRSIPRGPRRERLEAIPGAVPPLDALPSGCRFQPRCSRAEAKCSAEDPKLAPRVEERKVACFFPGEPDE